MDGPLHLKLLLRRGPESQKVAFSLDEPRPNSLVAILTSDLFVMCYPDAGQRDSRSLRVWGALRRKSSAQPAELTNGHCKSYPLNLL